MATAHTPKDTEGFLAIFETDIKNRQKKIENDKRSIDALQTETDFYRARDMYRRHRADLTQPGNQFVAKFAVIAMIRIADDFEQANEAFETATDLEKELSK